MPYRRKTRERKKRHNKTRRRSNGGKRDVAMKPMNCSPLPGKMSNSCYTPAILLKIRDAYNETHTEKITATDTKEIWIELKNRLDCVKEDCWLDQIKDDNLKKKIDRYVFAPDKPPEWEKNPNEWLSNFDIMNVLEQYELTYKSFDFIGPSPIDFDKKLGRKKCVWNELCNFNLANHLKKGKTKIGIIFNLDEHDKSGSHWVSLFIDTTEKLIFYFDSAGSAAPDEIRVFVDRVQKQTGNKYKYIENAPYVHQHGGSECGVYSLFFIITMLTHNGGVGEKKKMSMDEIVALFKSKRISDEYIEKYRNVYFNG